LQRYSLASCKKTGERQHRFNGHGITFFGSSPITIQDSFCTVLDSVVIMAKN
jgi:hypothetical protein